MHRAIYMFNQMHQMLHFPMYLNRFFLMMVLLWKLYEDMLEKEDCVCGTLTGMAVGMWTLELAIVAGMATGMV